MPASRLRPVPNPIERRDPDRMRVYLVRGLDMQWKAKRYGDGHVVASDEERAEAVLLARLLGYRIN